MTYPKVSGWPAERRAETKRANIHFSSIEKLVSSGKRKVRGIASSISIDRVGDIVVPNGGSWSLPVPLLWQHRHDEPIGWVRTLQVRGDVIWMEAEVAEGIGSADEAWKMIEAQLVDSFSIGFLGKKWEPLPDGGRKWISWALVEVSCVTVPANPDAKISRAGVRLADRNAGAVKLVSRGSRDGFPLKIITPGIKLRQPSGAPIKLIKPEPKRIQRRPDGAFSLRRDR